MSGECPPGGLQSSLGTGTVHHTKWDMEAPGDQGFVQPISHCGSGGSQAPPLMHLLGHRSSSAEDACPEVTAGIQSRFFTSPPRFVQSALVVRLSSRLRWGRGV